MRRALIIAGAQRFEPTVGPALAALGIEGPIAAVTAGWQERESEDDELRAHFGGRATTRRSKGFIFRSNSRWSCAHCARWYWSRMRMAATDARASSASTSGGARRWRITWLAASSCSRRMR